MRCVSTGIFLNSCSYITSSLVCLFICFPLIFAHLCAPLLIYVIMVDGLCPLVYCIWWFLLAYDAWRIFVGGLFCEVEEYFVD